MKENLAPALSAIFGHEGGFSNRPLKDDPGGATMWGVTQRTLEAWRKRPVTVNEVRNLKIEEAAEIYRKEYANRVSFDELPAGLDYAMLDYAINSGPAQAVRSLQRVLGVVQDGVIGPRTRDTIRMRGVVKMIDSLQDERWAFMQRLSNFQKNKNGWKTRVEDVRRKAKKMAATPVSPTAALDNIKPEITAANDHAAVQGADAKAMPQAAKVTGTSTGKGIVTAGLGTAVVTLGAGMPDTAIYAVLTTAGVLAVVLGLFVAYRAHARRLASGAPL